MLCTFFLHTCVCVCVRVCVGVCACIFAPLILHTHLMQYNDLFEAFSDIESEIGLSLCYIHLYPISFPLNLWEYHSLYIPLLFYSTSFFSTLYPLADPWGTQLRCNISLFEETRSTWTCLWGVSGSRPAARRACRHEFSLEHDLQMVDPADVSKSNTKLYINPWLKFFANGGFLRRVQIDLYPQWYSFVFSQEIYSQD